MSWKAGQPVVIRKSGTLVTVREVEHSNQWGILIWVNLPPKKPGEIRLPEMGLFHSSSIRPATPLEALAGAAE